MTWFEWMILIMATGRMTRLLVTDEIMEWFRQPFIELKEEGDSLYAYPKGRGLRKFIGSLLSCYWCTSVWVAVCFFVGFITLPAFFFPVFLCLSIAYGAAIFEAASRRL
ncbi:DUF1360 domain-containing protein [Shouchella sp. 1P09AA]|uniref:DUF1360 domain-containing protein n=1 Tax=unclassified Shouchella TaxID=2893065 RepID=UPI0039A17C17